MSLSWADLPFRRKHACVAFGGLEAFQQEILKRKDQPVEITVVLSNSLVRYALVPADAAVSGDAEELALARFHFTRIHGERAKDWELRLSDAPGAARRLASAVDPGLCEAIRKCFPRTARPRLRSIQPWLMAAFNAARPALTANSAWLVLVERGRACLALASREGWQAVQSVRVEAGEDLVALLERESLRSGSPPVRKALVHGAPARSAAGWELSQAILPMSFA